MTSISTSLSSFYQLFGQKNGPADTAAPVPQSLADALEVLSRDSVGSGNPDAYTLSLSPAAQARLSVATAKAQENA